MINTEKAIEILHNTHDGSDLDPTDLYITELAVNNSLSQSGQDAFNLLYEKVSAGKYAKPWLHDIEHLTIDHQGFVYWKGQYVEHYTMALAYSEKGRLASEDLAARCRHLEPLGVAINVDSVIWHWDRYKDLQPTTPIS